MVYERYPKTEKERTCWAEKMKRDGLRAEYKKRLLNEQGAASETEPEKIKKV